MRMTGGIMTQTVARLQFGHIRSLGHLGVHVLFPLSLPLLPPLLLRFVSFLLLENTAVTGGVLLLRLSQSSFVTKATEPTHQPGATVLETIHISK